MKSMNETGLESVLYVTYLQLVNTAFSFAVVCRKWELKELLASRLVSYSEVFVTT